MEFEHIGRKHVLAAMKEFDSKGLEAMLVKYRGGRSVKWYLCFEGRRYDQKLILRAAHAHAGGTSILKFTAGDSRIHFARLQFRVEKD